jgi:hypothetical protein
MAAAAVLAGCDRADEDINTAIKQDAILGDECFYTLTQRPEDCFERAPCAWWDASLRLSRSASGAYEMVAGPGGWDGGPPMEGPTVTIEAASPEALAHQFPQVLAALHETPPPVNVACVLIRPNQALSMREVVAFHDALEQQRLRHIGLYAELADH